jgi:hypothetical protein
VGLSIWRGHRREMPHHRTCVDSRNSVVQAWRVMRVPSETAIAVRRLVLMVGLPDPHFMLIFHGSLRRGLRPRSAPANGVRGLAVSMGLAVEGRSALPGYRSAPVA